MRFHRFQVIRALLCILATGFGGPAWAEEVNYLKAAHAHNDYAHRRPLLDALDHGFCSFEADIFLVGEELLVGHFRIGLRPERTLETLYLDPLLKRIGANGGRVYRGGPTVMLLVDIKNTPKETYVALRTRLLKYRVLFQPSPEHPELGPPVQVVLSGGRPFEDVKADPNRLCGMDGRLIDLDSKEPPDFMPLISDRWGEHFSYRGKGAMPNEEREKLESIVQRAHAAGRRVRFWATPESEAMWKTLLEAGVDHINTDKLDQLAEFLSHHGKTESTSSESNGRKAPGE